MRIFILEDDDSRIRYFRKQLEGNDNIIEVAKTVEEGREILSRYNSWDAIFLDHDLDGAVFVDSNNANTGYQLAKFIKQYIEYDRIIIHTMNPAGAANMKAVLEDAEVIPYSILDIRRNE